MHRSARIRILVLAGMGGMTLSACALSDRGEPTSTMSAAPSSITYACDNGSSIVATYDGKGGAVLTHEGETMTLATARSADGARYVGDGYQWWTKGSSEAQFAPLAPGETVATATPILCRAG